MSIQPDLILVDGSLYLFRAYYALPPLSNSKGEPTGAVVGVVNMLTKLLHDMHPTYIAVVFDAPGPNFREQLAPDYKAQRPPTPDDLVAQIKPLHEIIQALGLPMLSISGVEADDVIGTLANQASKIGLSTLIATGDKDFAQMVKPNITLLDTMQGSYLDIQGVKAKFGVKPEQITDFLALTGDKTDNIPGVPGCGPKTAVKWLNTYGNLESIINHAEEIKTKVGEALRANISQIKLGHELVTIKLDVALNQSPLDLRPVPPDFASLKRWYTHLEAYRLLNTLPADDSTPLSLNEALPATNYQIILDWSTFTNWLERLTSAQIFAVNFETISTNTMQTELIGITFAITAEQAAYIPLAHNYLGCPRQLDRNAVLAALKPLLENPQPTKLGHNLKNAVGILAQYGIKLRGIAFDIMLESYVLNSSIANHSLEILAKKYLQQQNRRFKDTAVNESKQFTLDQLDLEQAGAYTAENAGLILQLHQTLWPRLTEQPRLAQLLQELEIPLVPVLSRLERNGVRIDPKKLRIQSNELSNKIKELEQQAYATLGRNFNLNSPKQLSAILFEELQLPKLEKTPSGADSTAEDVLEYLSALGYELPQIILKYRTLIKLKSTYLDSLSRLMDFKTQRVHTCYNQAVTVTGRLSSSHPNLQNIPIRTEEGRRIRQAFIAADGCTLLAADYSQIELRIMAHLSDDAALLSAFAKDQDIHRATAAEIFDITPEAVTNEQRRSAKVINFGLIYGMSAFGLSRQLAISNREAHRYMELYFQRYPGVKEFMDRTKAEARKLGFVETLFGRRLYLPEINTRNPQRRAAAERTAINAPMQGTAADIIKRAMLDVDKWLQDTQIPARMIMQVHDELVFEVENAHIAQVQAQVKFLMERAAIGYIPLIVDCGTGPNWDVAH